MYNLGENREDGEESGQMDGTVVLTRDCDAVLIPTAVPIALEKGTEVRITQSLGGVYTVYCSGNLLRIGAQDADALGIVLEDSVAAALDTSGTLEEQVWRQLRTCYDPEIPVNIVDLGLVYECVIERVDNDDPKRHSVAIQMTLTAPGCGMGPILAMDVKEKLCLIPTIVTVDVQLVLDPPWDQSMMSQAARLQLGML